jgi:DNA-binding Lrp family transcriptional regulator
VIPADLDTCYVAMVDTVTIDDLDRQLVHCLSVDGRASFSQIAEILGVSDQTVARRYRRLRSSGVLRVVGLKAHKRVGTQSWFLRMQCVPGSGPVIAAALARRADTAWVQILSGDTEVLCALRGDARQERAALLSKLPRSDRIVAVTAHSLLHMFTGGPQGLRSLHVLPESRVEPLRYHVRGGHVELGDLDFALFSALGEDGRTPYADLAASTGWSESTVRRRMEQLRDVGVLYYDLEIDPPAFGFHAVTWLWMSVPPSRLASVGETIAKFPEVGYASATTGPANLAVCAVCHDEAELYEFLTGKVGALPDVTRTETSPVIRTLKQASATVLPVRP